MKRIDGRKGGRVYSDGGIEYTSVTTALSVISKPALVPWAAKMSRLAVDEHLRPVVGRTLTQEALDEALEAAKRRPTEVKDAASNLGTRAHEMIDAYLTHVQFAITPDLEPVLDGFQQWVEASDLALEKTERMLLSRKFDFAGTCDYIGKRSFDGGVVVVDFKTSNAIYPEHAVQVAAYAKALEEEDNIKVAEGWCVRLGKNNAEFEARQILSLDDAFETFLAALRLYKGMKQPQWVA